MMRNPRITGYNQKIYTVQLDDGSMIKCTDNHRFLMGNRTKRATIDLKSGDNILITPKWQITWAEIMGGREKKQNAKYWILNDGRKNILEHTFQKRSNPSLVEELYSQERALELIPGELCNNHKIISVRFNGYSTVYNGTVDDYHNYGIILNEKQTKIGLPKLEMLFTANCGEQTLESFELCCLVETFPSRHATYEEYQETLKYAYLYAKSVTLLRTHWKFTNAVMMKNRRIGISQTGITEAFLKHGRYKMLEWCDKGYNYLKQLDEAYSKWLGIPTSIKLTTVKPSGTLSLLPGVSHGIHFPHAEYYIRRVRVSENADILNVVKAAGYNIVKDLYSDNTYVVEFPIHNLNIDRAKKEVSMWEQAENAALYQKYWSDNQVSITITFQRKEAKEIKYLLECFEDKLKCLSFLPIEEHGYKQAPYEEITKEKFDEMSISLSPLNFDKVKDREIGSLFCETDKCEIHIKRE
jgi:adenosylcobalamin-dependent ribonucleoside-triphosphate reductase